MKFQTEEKGTNSEKSSKDIRLHVVTGSADVNDKVTDDYGWVKDSIINNLLEAAKELQEQNNALREIRYNEQKRPFISREDAKDIISQYYDYCMDYFNGHAKEEAIIILLDELYGEEE